MQEQILDIQFNFNSIKKVQKSYIHDLTTHRQIGDLRTHFFWYSKNNKSQIITEWAFTHHNTIHAYTYI